ncbi:hypothetical protein BCV70DRAFT_76358 [Testicularia cyperi]|uniref:Uncharacterized protein n=1 Tax=Testicularia cyperi TaxID=1882483 RepID=A0A317XUR0_9BASI|nr:hypothetical protein BCV70DRAFT_76358 [Testicularia cyperi]
MHTLRQSQHYIVTAVSLILSRLVSPCLGVFCPVCIFPFFFSFLFFSMQLVGSPALSHLAIVWTCDLLEVWG